MSNVLIKAFSNLKTTQEVNNYIEDLLELKKLPDWSVDIIPVLQNWVTKIIEDGNVLCAISVTRLLQRYILSSLQASDIHEILNIYMKLNNLVDITTKWKIPDDLLKIAFWESVNELHMTLCSKFPDSLNEFLKTFGSVFLQSCVDEELSLFLRQLRGKALNASLENSSHQIRNEFRTSNPQCIEKLTSTLEKVGDYDFQTSLIEMVFRLTSSSERSHLVCDWFPNLRCVTQHLFVRIKDFDPDCRRFLNAFNAEQGVKRRVFSFAAVKAQIGNFVLRKPNVPTYEQLWIDFNLGSGTISVLFDRSEPNMERSWETIIMYSHEVDKVELIKMHSQRLILELGRDPIDFFASPPSQDDCGLLDTKFSIEFATFIPDLENLCHTLYGDKLKVLEKKPEPLRSKSNQKMSMTIMCIGEENGERSEKYSKEYAAEENTEEKSAGIESSHLKNVENYKKSASISLTSIHVQSNQLNGEVQNSPSSNGPSEDASGLFDDIKPTKKLLSTASCSSNTVSTGSKHDKNPVSKVSSKFCTPASGKRFTQNDNFSSGTTSIFPMSPERSKESNSNNSLRMSKLKKIVNHMESPKKSSKKRKESKSVGEVVGVSSNDTKTSVNQIIVKPEVINKTNEMENISVTPEEEDEEIIPSSLSRMENDTSIICLTKKKLSSTDDDDDVIPSSIIKTSDSDVVEITKPDVTMSKKKKLKILDIPVSINEKKNIEHLCTLDYNETPINPATKNSSDSSPEPPKSSPSKKQNTEYEIYNDKAINSNNNNDDDVGFCYKKEPLDSTKDSEASVETDVVTNSGVELKVDAGSLNKFHVNVEKSSKIIMETPENESLNRYDNSKQEKVIDSADEKGNNSMSNEHFDGQKGEGESIIMIQNLDEISFTEELVKDALDVQSNEYLTVCTSDFQIHYFSAEECNNNNSDSSEQNKCKLTNKEEIVVIEGDEETFTKETPTIIHSIIERRSDEQLVESENLEKQIESSGYNTSAELICIKSNIGNVNVLSEKKSLSNIKDSREGFEKADKNFFLEKEKQDRALSSLKDNQLDIENSFHNLDNVEPIKEILDKVEKTDITTSYNKSCNKNVEDKEIFNEHDLNDKDCLYAPLLCTPNKFSNTDNQEKLVRTPTSPFACKVMPSKVLSSTQNISEQSVKTPSTTEKNCKTPSKWTGRNSSRKKKGTSVLPDHYTPDVYRNDASKNQGSSCKSKKKLFSTETANMLQDTPPEYSETIQVSKLSAETTFNNSEKKELELVKENSVLKLKGYQIFKSKQKQSNSKDDHLSCGNCSKSRTPKATASKFEKQSRRKSLFSDIEFSDASDSNLWLRKKSTKKLSIKTYRGKEKKKRMYQETTDSEEFVVGREKRKTKSYPPRERKRLSSSDEDDLNLFKSPKVARVSTRTNRIVTRSMTQKTTEKRKISSDRSAKRKHTFMDTFDSTISSPEVMRDTSLNQTASSFSEAQQISDINLTRPKNKKYKKFKDTSTCVNKINSSNESSIRNKQIDQYDLVKEVLMDTLPSNLNTQNIISAQSLPPNPPNNTPVSEYLEDKNHLEISNGIGSLSENKFGPQSTSSPKISYIGEPCHSYVNSSDDLDKDKCCTKSPTGLKISKLNFENNEKDPVEDLVLNTPYRRDFMIPTHPNSDFSSSDELEPVSHPELLKPNDQLKTNQRKKVLYIRKTTNSGEKPEDGNEEIFLSPLIPQSLENLLKSSLNSDVTESVPFTHSNCFKTTTENGGVCITNSLCTNSQRAFVKKGGEERADVTVTTHKTQILTKHSIRSETPRASINQNAFKTPSKLCPKSLFENERYLKVSTPKQTHSRPDLEEEPGSAESCSTSAQSRRDNEPKSQESNRLASDTVRVPLSTLNLLLEEVRTMGDLFKQNSRKCSVIYEVFKNMINRPVDRD